MAPIEVKVGVARWGMWVTPAWRWLNGSSPGHVCAGLLTIMAIQAVVNRQSDSKAAQIKWSPPSV